LSVYLWLDLIYRCAAAVLCNNKKNTPSITIGDIITQVWFPPRNVIALHDELAGELGSGSGLGTGYNLVTIMDRCVANVVGVSHSTTSISLCRSN